MPTPLMDRRTAFALSAGILASTGIASNKTTSDVHLQYDHVLGTSLDVILDGTDPSNLDAIEHELLGELERLRLIFSLYEPSSELARINSTVNQDIVVSQEMQLVLRCYQEWIGKTRGACNPQLGRLTSLWNAAEARQITPSDVVVNEIVHSITRPNWTLRGNIFRKTSTDTLNLNCVAKGFIIDQLRAVALKHGVAAGLVNLGGDITAWGDHTWAVGVQRPNEPAENATHETVIALRNQSVASSGGYQRFRTIQGQRFSHLLDPRTGKPAATLTSATVIAPNSLTANVLATSFCLLSKTESFALLEQTLGSAAMLFDEIGEPARSTNFASFELTPNPADEKKPEAKKEEKKKDEGKAWPADYEVKINLELIKPTAGRARRPYVAVWIENSDGKAVRTVTVWGSGPKWIGTLSGWWPIGKEDKDLVKAVTRATRAPGKYEVIWDGKDDAGKMLPQGKYTVKIEVHREHGKDVTQSGKLECLAEPKELKLESNAEAEESVVNYGKKEKKENKEKK